MEYLFLRIKNLYLLLFLLPAIGGCNAVFYHPTPDILITPKRLNFAYEEVNFKSLDGTALNGWFIPGQGKIHGTIIHFHGNFANISNHYAGVYWLPEYGYNLFLFDYRGFGKSGGAPSREGIQMDGAAAIQYLRSRPDIDTGNLIVYGQSLGGAIAAYTVANQSREGIRAVVLESVFTRYRKIARDKLNAFWLTWPLQWPLSFLISDQYSPLEQVHKISPIPLLIVHGDADEVIPYWHGEELFRQAGEPKAFWSIKGGHHIDAFSPNHPDNRKRLLEFFHQSLQNPPRPAQPQKTSFLHVHPTERTPPTENSSFQ